MWDFALPDRLSFVPQMNAYGLPDAQETAYYRLAHEHRTCLNCLRYSWQGRVADGCAPKSGRGRLLGLDGLGPPVRAAPGRFGLRRSARAGAMPVDNFYLPLNENWPMDHERAYRGGYWIENAYPESYWAEFRAAGRAIRPAHRGKGMDATRPSSSTSTTKSTSRPSAAHGRNAPRRGSSTSRSTPRTSGPCGGSAGNSSPATGGARNLVFRCDISRPEWQRDLLDGVCGEEVVSGGPAAVSRPHPGPAGAVRADGSSSTAARTRSARRICSAPPGAWTPGASARTAWCRGTPSARPGRGPSRTRPACSIPTEKGPLPSLRLKAFCHGQQLVEYLAIFTQLAGHDRRSVADGAAPGTGARRAAQENLRGRCRNDELRSPLAGKSRTPPRFRLGSWIAAQKPADRRSWTAPRCSAPSIHGLMRAFLRRALVCPRSSGLVDRLDICEAALARIIQRKVRWVEQTVLLPE